MDIEIAQVWIPLYDKLLKHIENLISEINLQAALKDYVNIRISLFLDKNTDLKNFICLLRVAVRELKDSTLENMSWLTLCTQLKTVPERVRGIIVSFYGYLAEKKMLSGEYAEYLMENLWLFRTKKAMAPILDTFSEDVNPHNIYDFIFDPCSSNMSHTRYNLNSTSNYIRSILIDFLQSLTPKQLVFHRIREFIYNFENSLQLNGSLPGAISDFNAETFRHQYTFYKKANWGAQSAVNSLCKFYLYLIDRAKADSGIGIFLAEDGLDENFLLRQDFNSLYEKGFRVVLYNINDPVPEHDKWLLAPNGAEKYSVVKREYTYEAIDFSRVSNNQMRYLVKCWYWYNSLSIYAKSRRLYVVFQVVEMLSEITHKNALIIPIQLYLGNENSTKAYEITSDIVLSLRFFIQNKFDNNTTRNSFIIAAKDFIKFLYDNTSMRVDFEVFDYLVLFKKKKYSGKPIVDDDLNHLIKVYKEKANNGDLDNDLYWIIFNLCVTTNLRIGEVLNLKRNCTDEKMKKGQYALRYEVIDEDNQVNLHVERKESKGKPKEVNINKYTYRLICKALEITNSLANEAISSDSANYIFLHKTIRNSIRVINQNTFYHCFKRITDQYNLIGGPYSVNNLRHTFMTAIYRQGKKEGRSIFEMHQSTGHADLRTTLGYRATRIRDYLEAFYGVQIGNVDIKGTIIIDASKVMPIDKEITVKEKCGYCSNRACLWVECLICSNFITDLARIPYFKRCIKKLEKDIIDSKLEHERELLVTQKILFVAYLERLYLLKEAQTNDYG